jgi:hypothetical protein
MARLSLLDGSAPGTTTRPSCSPTPCTRDWGTGTPGRVRAGCRALPTPVAGRWWAGSLAGRPFPPCSPCWRTSKGARPWVASPPAGPPRVIVATTPSPALAWRPSTAAPTTPWARWRQLAAAPLSWPPCVCGLMQGPAGWPTHLMHPPRCSRQSPPRPLLYSSLAAIAPLHLSLMTAPRRLPLVTAPRHLGLEPWTGSTVDVVR